MIPRCLILFENACKSKRTFKTYKFLLDKFLNWCHKDHESFLMLPITELEDLLQDYCIFQRKRVNIQKVRKTKLFNTKGNPIYDIEFFSSVGILDAPPIEKPEQEEKPSKETAKKRNKK